MIGNGTVDASHCKPDTLLYSSDECNKQPCGEGKTNSFFLYKFIHTIIGCVIFVIKQ